MNMSCVIRQRSYQFMRAKCSICWC